MYLEELLAYREGLDSCLTKLDIATEVDETGRTVVMTTKETYVFEDEEDADKMVCDARRDVGFMEAKKKFKLGKINKNGEIVRPDTYTVVIKLAH